MGCDIHSYAEVRGASGWRKCGPIFDNPYKDYNIAGLDSEFSEEPLNRRNYGLFGWLADVRNYSGIEPLCLPKGLPVDTPQKEDIENDWDYHSASYFTLAELLAVDYNAPIEDLRYMKQTGPHSWNGGATAEPGQGKVMSLREFLPNEFFSSLKVLADLGMDPKDVRIIFYFDN